MGLTTPEPLSGRPQDDRRANRSHALPGCAALTQAGGRSSSPASTAGSAPLEPRFLRLLATQREQCVDSLTGLAEASSDNEPPSPTSLHTYIIPTLAIPDFGLSWCPYCLRVGPAGETKRRSLHQRIASDPAHHDSSGVRRGYARGQSRGSETEPRRTTPHHAAAERPSRSDCLPSTDHCLLRHTRPSHRNSGHWRLQPGCRHRLDHWPTTQTQVGHRRANAPLVDVAIGFARPAQAES
jgi:hypothetical protein